eukprot:TRINITY_DN1681_c0_g1_i12.p1 TRINITY_DN1681_c0_g1~~TRINITY_DN1681_c0_g1_i12.p1  ORF type:complete len:612 (-),score=39.74 TRINITY_DN1681_c0_g1_i12:228-2063(-)
MFNTYFRYQSVLNTLSDRVAVTNVRLQQGDNMDIQIAIIKATNRDQLPPKEKHVRALKLVANEDADRDELLFMIKELQEKLRCQEWLIVLKTLIVFHRLIREADIAFVQELSSYESGRVFSQVCEFKDINHKENQQYAEFIRVYANYLTSRLQVYTQIGYDSDRYSGPSVVEVEVSAKIEAILLFNKFINQIVMCVPEGQAAVCEIILKCVMIPLQREVMKVYGLVQKTLRSLMDDFFNLSVQDAKKCATMFRQSVDTQQRLQNFLTVTNNLDIVKNAVQIPKLETIPPEFLQQIDEYIKTQRRQEKQNCGSQIELTQELHKSSKRECNIVNQAQTRTDIVDLLQWDDIPQLPSGVQSSIKSEDNLRANLLDMDTQLNMIQQDSNNVKKISVKNQHLQNHQEVANFNPFLTKNTTSVSNKAKDQTNKNPFIQPVSAFETSFESSKGFQDFSLNNSQSLLEFGFLDGNIQNQHSQLLNQYPQAKQKSVKDVSKQQFGSYEIGMQKKSLSVKVPINPFTQTSISPQFSNKNEDERSLFEAEYPTLISPQSSSSPLSQNDNLNIRKSTVQFRKDPLDEISEDLGLRKSRNLTVRKSMNDMKISMMQNDYSYDMK